MVKKLLGILLLLPLCLLFIWLGKLIAGSLKDTFMVIGSVSGIALIVLLAVKGIDLLFD